MARDIFGEIIGVGEDEIWNRLESLAMELGVEDIPTDYDEFVTFFSATPAIHPDEHHLVELDCGPCLIARHGKNHYRLTRPEGRGADWWDGLEVLPPVEYNKALARMLRRMRFARPVAAVA